MQKSRWNKKLKRWHDKKSQIAKKRRVSKTQKGIERSSGTQLSDTVVSRKNKPSEIHLQVPSVFSLTVNTEETMFFFMNLMRKIKERKNGSCFFIDSENVKEVTVDALIYLITIMQNDRINLPMRYQYRGNFPLNESARKIYEESGFTNYVHSQIRLLPPNTEKMRIISGFKNDSDVSKQFCEFVMEKLNKSRIEIKTLQVILIELMSNVYHHAYKKKDELIAKKWYMYAEHIDNYVRFVFADTGMGIAETVRKNFEENIKRWFAIGVEDGVLLKSAFSGDFRTQTGQPHRGNGLSTVRECVLKGPFFNFEVISGKGKCIISKEQDNPDKLEICNYKGTIYGTLYTFDIY